MMLMMMIMLMIMMLMMMMTTMMMMIMMMMMMMRRPSSLRVRAKPRHLPYIYIYHLYIIYNRSVIIHLSNIGSDINDIDLYTGYLMDM